MNDMSRQTAISRRNLIKGTAGVAVMSALGLAPGCSPSGPATTTPNEPRTLPERLSQHREIIIALDASTVSAPFDPIQGWGGTGVNLFNSALLATDENNEIVPDLATGYTIGEDKLTWVFTMRDDARFTSGAQVTAADVAFTYNQAKKTGKVSMPNFNEAVATGERTVELRLSAPSSVLLYTTAVLGIVPQAGYSDSYGDRPIGSGPWKLVDYIQGQQLIIERNDDYHGEKARFARATILMMDTDACLAAAKAGNVDVACTYPNMSRQQVDGFTLTSLPTFDYRVISLPCQRPGAWEVEGKPVGNAVTSDRELRRAMALGLNRKQLVDDCLLGYGEVAFDMFDAFPWGIKQDTADLKDGDVDSATRILDQAGWRSGAGGIRAKGDLRASFVLYYPPSDSARQAIAEGFKAQMQPLGIDVQLEGLDFTGIQENNRVNAVVLGGGNLTPYNVYRQLASAGTREKNWINIACYTNQAVDENLALALAATDTETAHKHWHDALWDGRTGGSILGDSPYLMCCYIKNNYFVRDGVDIGAQQVHPHNHFLHIIQNLHTWDVRL